MLPFTRSGLTNSDHIIQIMLVNHITNPFTHRRWVNIPDLITAVVEAVGADIEDEVVVDPVIEGVEEGGSAEQEEEGQEGEEHKIRFMDDS